MTEEQANMVASVLGGDVWQSGGGIWLVVIHRSDGVIVTISDEVICEFPDEAAFEGNRAAVPIVLT